jgi:crossover junction endodeoxyribonuclease RusA
MPQQLAQYEIVLPYDKPPLSLNQRLHWAVKAKLVKEVRTTTERLAQQLEIPPLEAVEITLIYTPKTARKRDTDNLFATLKPAVDGLVDAGVIADDNTEIVTKLSVLIAPVSKTAPKIVLFLHETCQK